MITTKGFSLAEMTTQFPYHFFSAHNMALFLLFSTSTISTCFFRFSVKQEHTIGISFSGKYRLAQEGLVPMKKKQGIILNTSKLGGDKKLPFLYFTDSCAQII